MDKNDIIRMAREAGMVRVTSPSGIELGQWWGVELMDIERFADLVASVEREACAKRLDAVGCDHCATNIRARGNHANG